MKIFLSSRSEHQHLWIRLISQILLATFIHISNPEFQHKFVAIGMNIS